MIFNSTFCSRTMSTNNKFLSQLLTVGKNRKEWLAMSVEEKRDMYRCREDFVVLDDVPNWNEYYQENQKKLDWGKLLRSHQNKF